MAWVVTEITKTLMYQGTLLKRREDHYPVGINHDISKTLTKTALALYICTNKVQRKYQSQWTTYNIARAQITCLFGEKHVF